MSHHFAPVLSVTFKNPSVASTGEDSMNQQFQVWVSAPKETLAHVLGDTEENFQSIIACKREKEKRKQLKQPKYPLTGG